MAPGGSLPGSRRPRYNPRSGREGSAIRADPVPPDDSTAADRRMESVMATCPECEYDEIDTDDLEEGEHLSCPECGKSLVMVGGDDLDVADDDDEDDLDDDDEEEDLEDDDGLEDDDLDDDEEDHDE